MARKRSATEQVRILSKNAVKRGLDASLAAGGMKPFYQLVDMINPSRSYFVRYRGHLHSLKAVVTFALRQELASSRSTDFHAADAARRLRELKFDVIHNIGNVDEERERQWISRLKRDGQVEFRAALIDVYRRCALSGCTTLAALEAAHVRPVSGHGADATTNGILLRADLHKLFDANLLAIDPSTGSVALEESCKADYGDALAGRSFLPPLGGPSLQDFAPRWQAFIGG